MSQNEHAKQSQRWLLVSMISVGILLLLAGVWVHRAYNHGHESERHQSQPVAHENDDADQFNGHKHIAEHGVGSDDQRATPVHVDLRTLPGNITITMPEYQIDHELVLVPGDTHKDIASFYIGKYEVTWKTYLLWIDDRHENTEADHAHIRRLRPSPPYYQFHAPFGHGDQPVTNVRIDGAYHYCRWLTEKTGLWFRLPTENEWQHAYVQGGGDVNNPPTQQEADRIAVYENTSFCRDEWRYKTQPVGQRSPNRIGIHDMAGNVAEWTIQRGGAPILRGGHFQSPLEELGIGRHPEQPAWSENDPNVPPGPWWYVDAPWAGFRVIVEIDDALIQRYAKSPQP